MYGVLASKGCRVKPPSWPMHGSGPGAAGVVSTAADRRCVEVDGATSAGTHDLIATGRV
jgi:hypothetical protein